MPFCFVCGLQSTFKCSQCNIVYYCGKEHQNFDWKTHKSICQGNRDVNKYDKIENSFHKNRNLGNDAYKRNDLNLAIDFYSKALNSVTDDQEKIIVLSNRSQCYFNMIAYSESLKDAETALCLDPSHLKSAVRAAKASFMLRLPERTVSICSSELASKPENLKFFSQLLEDSKRALLEKYGQYDLPAMIESVQSDCSLQASHFDFVHSGLSVVLTQEKGRIVITNEDILPNTLIMVTKSFCSMQKMQISDDFNRKFALKISGQLEKMLPKDKLLFFSLTSGDDDHNLSADIYNEEIRRLNTEDFTSVGTTAGVSSSAEAEIERIKLASPIELNKRIMKIIKSNAFESLGNVGNVCSDLDQKLQTIRWQQSLSAMPTAEDYREFKQRKGPSVAHIFILPSLLNHSCCPNADYSLIGDYLVMRTTKFVPKGIELTNSYIDSQKSFHDRTRILESWIGPSDGFKCDCTRCQPIISINETTAQRLKRADSEKLLTDAHSKITALIVREGLPKNVAIETVIPTEAFDNLKNAYTRLPLENQEILSMLLEYEVGLYCDSGDVQRAFDSIERLMPIMDKIGSRMQVLKYSLVKLSLKFYVEEDTNIKTSTHECLSSIKLARQSTYPEIRLDKSGNESFQFICESYCFLIQNHRREKKLRDLILQCRM